MRERTFHPEIKTLSLKEVRSLVDELKHGKVIKVDHICLKASEPGQPIRQCHECDLPRPCRNERSIPNICQLCIELDLVYWPRKTFARRTLILADYQDY